MLVGELLDLDQPEHQCQKHQDQHQTHGAGAPAQQDAGLTVGPSVVRCEGRKWSGREAAGSALEEPARSAGARGGGRGAGPGAGRRPGWA